MTFATPVCSCKGGPFIMFWQSKLHLTEQKPLKCYLFHFHKKKTHLNFQGCHWDPAGSSVLPLASHNCWDRARENKRETPGRPAKALCPTRLVWCGVFLERNILWDSSTSSSWQLQHSEAPRLWSHFTRRSLDLLRTRTNKPVFFMPTARRREWFCLASILPNRPTGGKESCLRWGDSLPR